MRPTLCLIGSAALLSVLWSSACGGDDTSSPSGNSSPAGGGSTAGGGSGGAGAAAKGGSAGAGAGGQAAAGMSGQSAAGGQAGAGAGGQVGAGAGGQGGGASGQAGASGQSGGAGGQSGGASGQAGGSGGAGAGGQAGAGGGGPACAAGRSEGDRPDDEDGYQIRINYVLPSDGVDDMLDVNGKIETSVQAWSGWFASQAGGPKLRLDTCGGKLDVRFVRLDKTEAELKAMGVFVRDGIEQGMAKAGLLSATKLEGVYYGGDAQNECGGGAWPPSLIGHVGAVYLKGTFDNPDIPPCVSNPLGADPAQPGYLDFSMLHELMHCMGIVPACAPHQTKSGHVSDSPHDLMYAGDLPWQPTTLDVGKDDYFGADIPGCLSLSKSVFLSPLPDGAQTPPGW